MRRTSSGLVIAVVAGSVFATPAPLYASGQSDKEMSGRCSYPDRVAQYRSETTLILCDTAAIDRDADDARFVFSQRSRGPMAAFLGTMSGNRMTVSQITLRDGRALAATGTCEVYYDDHTLDGISCLARAGSRSVAANFVRSRI